MKTKLKYLAPALLALSILNPIFSTAFAQGTAFTYQGRLNNGASPANGIYDLRFAVYDSISAGTQQGALLTNSAIAVSNGLFTAALDFGNQFSGADRWLEIAVRTNGSVAFVTLNPRQQLTPTPYALYAPNAGTALTAGSATVASSANSVLAGNISGTIPLAQLPATLVTNGASGLTLAGTFSGNGAGMSNVNAATLNGLNATNFWQTGGNNVAAGQFLGSTNNQPLELWVNNQRAFRIESTTNTPNIIGGWSNNYAAPGVVMATIGGGGGQSLVSSALFTNAVWSSYGTVGGGIGNQAGSAGGDTTSARGATVGGGGGNIAGALFSAVSGGENNTIIFSGDFSFIGGGYANQIQTNSVYSFIGGGYFNQVTNSYATVLGGYYNVAGGIYSIAGGVGARALHQGATVLADSQFNYFDSTTTNEFSIRAQNGVRIQADKGVHLNAADEPIIVRDWDVFAPTAPASKAGIGRWGMFMEPGILTIGIPSNDVPGRYFQIAEYNTNGTYSTLMLVDQGGNVTASNFNISGGGTFTGNGSGLTGLNATNLTGTVPLTQLPLAVVTNGASGLNLSGTFSGNGAGVTNVAIGTLNAPGLFTWPGNFVLASSPAVGSSPLSVVAADVNGDGKVDLISANATANTLSVLTNNGSGGFAPASSPNVGNRPISVTAADVNGDGKVDLISANQDANTLTVLTNNGNGGFALSSSPGVGIRPTSVTAADVNGDGKVDLISANDGVVNTLTVLTNNGSGGFGLSSSPGVGINPEAVMAADVNGDGKPDLISANTGANTLTVLTNNGSGGFVLASTPVVGLYPYSVGAADVNGDGKVDLISVNIGDKTLTVLTNNGSGGFVVSSSPGVGTQPVSVTAADVNGDGKVDLISANNTANTLTVLTNNGSGGFVTASSPGVGSGPIWVVSADVNGDGKLDLISANASANTLSVLFNTPTFTGSFAGDGSGLTGVSANNISSGTVADARLSANVALRASGNNFTGDQSVTSGSLGIGTTSPGKPLVVQKRSQAEPAFMVGGGLPGGPRIQTYGLDVDGNAWMGLGSDMGGGPYEHSVYFPVGNSNGKLTIGSYDGTTYLTKLVVGVNGNVGIGINNPTNKLHVAGGVSATVFITTSDRNAKESFQPVSPVEILDKVAALPITRWTFKEMPGQPHMGPMAQDFHAAFGLGAGDTGIATVDADGVALAAIQGLNQKVETDNAELRAANAELKQQNDSLAARLNDLEAIVKQFATHK